MSKINPQNASGFFNLIEDPMPNFFRTAVIIYVFIYRIITPPAALLIQGSNFDLIFARTVVEAILEIVIILPIIFIRRAGYFHPLVFPGLLSIAVSVMSSPVHVFMPFLISSKLFIGDTSSWSYVLNSLSQFEYNEYRLYFSFFTIIFTLSLYAGYFVFSKKRLNPDNHYKVYDYIPMASIIAIAASCFVAFLLFQSSGGLAAHVLALTRGRYQTLVGVGAVIGIVKIAVIGLLVWMAAAKVPPIKNPWFWLATVIVLPIVWIADGSRGTLIYTLIGLVALYSLRTRRLPFIGASVAGVAALVVLGLLGAIRQDYNQTRVDTSILSVDNFGEWLEHASSEVTRRSADESEFAAFVAANKFGLLYGETYLAVIVFPIPRFIWAEKPRTGHAYNTWIAFMGNLGDDNPAAWGMPTGPVAEAYWNFGLLGPPLVGFIVGSVLGVVVSVFRSRPNSAGMAVMYVVFILYFTGDSREAQYVIQYGASVWGIFMLATILQTLFSSRPRAVRRHGILT